VFAAGVEFLFLHLAGTQEISDLIAFLLPMERAVFRLQLTAIARMKTNFFLLQHFAALLHASRKTPQQALKTLAFFSINFWQNYSPSFLSSDRES